MSETKTDQPSFKIRDLDECQQLIGRLAKTIWNKRAEGHLWSIPADPERDFDFILTDVVAELRQARADRAAHAAALAEKEQRIAELEAEANAYEEGLFAARNGKPRSANPYPSGDSFHVPVSWHMWDDGYDACQTRALLSTIAEKDAEIARLKADIQEMVDKAARNLLEGYRELGRQTAQALNERDDARAERDAAYTRGEAAGLREGFMAGRERGRLAVDNEADERVFTAFLAQRTEAK